MTKPDFPEEFEKDETPEEYIKNRVADIDQKKGYLYAQAQPEFPAIDKARSIAAINELCDEIEKILPEVETLIRRIFPHIASIAEQTKVAAAYLLIGRAYTNLKTAILVCRHGRNLEAMELSRSGKEALDLAMLFWDDNNKALLEKWFKGKIIGNVDAREYHHEHLNRELADFYDNEEQPIKEMMGAGYKIMSSYTHSGYAGLLDSVDVFRLDYDFEEQSGYHYCVDNFHIVEDLLIKILLNLKNSFLYLKDQRSFEAADKLFKPFDNGLTKEQMMKVMARHKKESGESKH